MATVIKGPAPSPLARISVEGRAPCSPLSRILSGSVGSIVYCLAFTPLEVVKTRQQASSSPSSPASPLKAFHRGRGAVMLRNGLRLPKNAFPCLVAPQYQASKTAGICARFFESATHLIQPRHLDKPGGILQTLVSISRNEGRGGLYKGLRPTLLAAVPNTAIYFTAYEDVTSLFRQYHSRNGIPHDGSKQKVYVPLIAGATARLMSSVTTAPLELIRTRQATGGSRGVLDEFRYLLKKNGPLALYRGLGPMIMRDIPFSALYFLSLESAKELLSNSNMLGPWGTCHYTERGMKIPTSVEVNQAFLSGATAGAIATLAIAS